MMKFLAAPVLLATLIGCSGESRMPPGFNESCYGGSFNEHLAGATPAYFGKLTLDRASQPGLRRILFQLADKHGLRAFDDGANYDNDFFSVYLCSSKGALVMVDSRGSRDSAANIVVFQYKDTWAPGPFVDDLRSAVTARWPNALQDKDLSDVSLGSSIF